MENAHKNGLTYTIFGWSEIGKTCCLYHLALMDLVCIGKAMIRECCGITMITMELVDLSGVVPL